MDRAAIDPAAWPEVCDGLSELVGAAGAMFVPLRVQARTHACPYSPAIEEPISVYLRDWTGRDYRGERGFPVVLARGVAADQDFSTAEQIRNCPFYNELLAPYGYKWCLAMSFRVNDDIWAAVLQGRLMDDPFGNTQKALVSSIRPHLSIAARRAAASGFDRIEDWRATLESTGRAVLALDATGRVLAVSPAAEALLGPHLQVRRGRPTVADPGLQARLEALVSAAIRYDPAALVPMPPPVTLRRCPGVSLLVDAVPLPRNYQTLLTRVVALLMVREVDEGTDGLQGVLRARFGLTPAEARLAQALAEGASLRDAAERNGIRLNTARAQLRSIFSKTDTHRQGELIALLTRAC